MEFRSSAYKNTLCSVQPDLSIGCIGRGTRSLELLTCRDKHQAVYNLQHSISTSTSNIIVTPLSARFPHHQSLQQTWDFSSTCAPSRVSRTRDPPAAFVLDDRPILRGSGAILLKDCQMMCLRRYSFRSALTRRTRHTSQANGRLLVMDVCFVTCAIWPRRPRYVASGTR